MLRRFDIRRLPRQFSGDELDVSPIVVFYELTQACQLACRHCRACAQSEPHPGELTRAESRRLLDQLARFPQPPALVLTGGDPFMRRDIYSLVDSASARGLEVAVSPSSTPLVTRAALRRLRDAGIGRLSVSLDGGDQATHDGIRGVSGSYDRTWEIIATARDLGIPLQINTTMQPANIAQIDLIAEQIAGFDIVLWSVFFLVPVGRAETLPRLTAEQYEVAFARLWRHSQVHRYRIKTTEAPHYRRFALRQVCGYDSQGRRADALRSRVFQTAKVGVNDGKGVMFISHVGLIYPSGFLPIVCGMFPLSDLVDVYQNSPIFRALRRPDRLEGKCRLCEYRTICGGSRARAYAVTGNVFAQEPDCNYVPAALGRC